jgi:hypothetical protein
VRIYYFFGLNPLLDSGYSMKLWKIERSGTTLYVGWASARLLKRKRKAIPARKVQWKELSFASKSEAKAEMWKRIEDKLGEGYERAPRRKPRT